MSVDRMYLKLLGPIVGLGLIAGGAVWLQHRASRAPAHHERDAPTASSPWTKANGSPSSQPEPAPALPEEEPGALPKFSGDKERRAYVTRHREGELETAKGFELAGAELEASARELESTGQSAAHRVVLARIEEIQARAARHRERAARYDARLSVESEGHPR